MSRLEGQFELVAMPHTRSLLRFARRLTRDALSAEDLVKETLLVAWRGFRGFETGTNARAWLFRILINAFNAQNGNAPSPALVLRAGIGAISDSCSEYPEITRALDRLSADQRTVLLLAAVEGFTCREIADILTTPIGTVMSRLSRARSALGEWLSPHAGRHIEKVLR